MITKIEYSAKHKRIKIKKSKLSAKEKQANLLSTSKEAQIDEFHEFLREKQEAEFALFKEQRVTTTTDN